MITLPGVLNIASRNIAQEEGRVALEILCWGRESLTISLRKRAFTNWEESLCSCTLFPRFRRERKGGDLKTDEGI